MMSKGHFYKIMGLALPIIGGAVSQNMLNLIDTAMVGKLGSTAVAASGLGSFANFMSQAIILGLSSGVQAISSRRNGEGETTKIATALNTGLIIAITLGPILSLLVYNLIPYIVPFLNSDADVVKLAIPYWRIRVVVILFVGINFSFRGFFNGIKMPRVYMTTLIVMHITNIILNYILIFGHLGFKPMGVEGAAIASSISVVLGSFVYFIMAFFQAREFGFFKIRPTVSDFLTLIRISLPSGLQQLFFAAGFTALFAIIGSIGTDELAVANILINIVLVCILPGFGFGLAAATLIGTSLGQKEFKMAEMWAYEVAKIGAISSLIVGAILAIFCTEIFGIFLKDQEIINIGIIPLMMSGAVIWLDVVGIIFMNALIGAGDSRSILKSSILFQWFFFLPFTYIGVNFFSFGLITVWALFCFYRFALGAKFLYLWHKKGWMNISI